MRTAFIVFFAVMSLPAHGQTPPCSDTRTIELVKRIFEQAIERRVAGQPRAKDIVSGVMARSSVTVRSIRTAMRQTHHESSRETTANRLRSTEFNNWGIDITSRQVFEAHKYHKYFAMPRTFC